MDSKSDMVATAIKEMETKEDMELNALAEIFAPENGDDEPEFDMEEGKALSDEAICSDGKEYHLGDAKKLVFENGGIEITSDSVCKKLNEDVQLFAPDSHIKVSIKKDLVSHILKVRVSGKVCGEEIVATEHEKRQVLGMTVFNRFIDFEGFTEPLVNGLNSILKQMWAYMEKEDIGIIGTDCGLLEIYKGIYAKAVQLDELTNHNAGTGVTVDNKYIHIKGLTVINEIMKPFFCDAFKDRKVILTNLDEKDLIVKNAGYQYCLGDGSKEYRIKIDKKLLGLEDD